MTTQDQVDEILEAFDFKIERMEPSDWSEKHRYMTPEISSFPGPFSYERTPYLKEVIDCLSPEHPARVVAVMKGAQIGFSAGVIDNGVGYIISENPGNILYSVGHSDLIGRAMEKVDQMIDSTGLRPQIRSNTLRARKQKTGDTNLSKEFPGGRLTMFSATNHKFIRQLSARYGFIDDYEAIRSKSKESGSSFKLIEQRFAAYADKRKIYLISTPEVKQTSNIEPAFLRGDQRRYYVPCPLCHEHILLEWIISKDGEKAGVSWKLDHRGQVVEGSVGYVCQECGGFFKDKHKHQMNLDGDWRPTARAAQSDWYSYHISALYAPVGMFNWEKYAIDYVEAHPQDGAVDIGKAQTFQNVVLGMTWEERGEAIKSIQLAKNAGRYDVGIVPDELSLEDGNGSIVLLTCACDLNGVIEDARLDYEIVAWAANGSSYSVDHGSIGTFISRETASQKKKERSKWTYRHGLPNSVWPEFEEIISKQVAGQTGKMFDIIATGVDTGQYNEYAYPWIENTAYTAIALKGEKENKLRRFDADTPIFKKSREVSGLFLVEVNLIKDRLSSLVKLKWDSQGEVKQPSGYMNFPTPEKGKYDTNSFFIHYQAEHKVMEKNAKGDEVGFRWVKIKSHYQNHQFDNRIYNIAIKEIVTDEICKGAKQEVSWTNLMGILGYSQS